MGLFGGNGDEQRIEFENPYEQDIRGIVNATNQARQTVQDIGPFQGEFIAGADPLQQQGLQQRQQALSGLAGPGGQPFGQGVVDLGQRTLAGEFLNANNPYLQGAIQAAANPLLEAQERALQQAGLGAIGQGAFGGNRLGLLQSDLAQQTQQNIGDIAGRLAFENLQNERNRQVQAGNLLAQGAGLGQLPGQLLGEIGGQQRGFTQDALQNELLKFQELNEAPFRGIIPAAEILNTLGVQGTPPTQISGAESGGPGAGDVIQGALGGAASGFTVGGPWGALAGGLLGGGAAFL